MSALLAPRFRRYVALEPDGASFELARERLAGVPGADVVRAEVSTFEPGARFDLVCAFEVLEHFRDDAAVVAEWRARVRPGGWLLLSVPAGPQRFAAWDRKAGHFRRYDRAALRELLIGAGFEAVVVLAYGFPAGYGLEAVRNAIARRERTARSLAERTAASGRALQPPAALAALTHAAALPLRFAQRPFERGGLGTGLVASARRPPEGTGP